MQFVDEAKITVKAGHGGAGAVSFHRAKYLQNGGPDGGNGGRGGNIVLRVDSNLSTLLDYRYKKKYLAKNGESGAGRMCNGRDGEDIVVRLPPGTVVKDQDTGEIIRDLKKGDDDFVLCKGGRGGKGNAHFKSSTHQAPRFSQPGEEGETRKLVLELKLLADVGLVGLPSVGKSSLIAAISAAKPKIADYPFTTLKPNLGVVKVDDEVSYVVADVPGLIEGAHEGVGLGIRFLKHIERTSVLCHMLDVSTGNDLEGEFKTIRNELSKYDPGLLERRYLVVFNKMDAVFDREAVDKFVEKLLKDGFEVMQISVATRQGIQDLIVKLSKLVYDKHYYDEF